MDVILVPPQTVISTYPHDDEAGEETYLYVLDRGYVSAFAILEHRHPHAADHFNAPAEAAPTVAQEASASRLRLAKYGPGTILGIASFVMPRKMPGLAIMPMVTIADTFCQVNRTCPLASQACEAPVPLTSLPCICSHSLTCV